MKKQLIILLLAAFSALAADEKPAQQRVSLDIFGGVNTPDFNGTTELAGVGVNFELTDYLGISTEAYGHDVHGLLVDEAAANLRYKIKTKTKSTPYVLGGGFYNLESEGYGIHVGVGVEHKFTSRFAAFADIRMVKPLDSVEDPSAQVRVGIRGYLF